MFDTWLISHFAFDTESYDYFANNIIHSRPSEAHALIFVQVFDLLDSENSLPELASKITFVSEMCKVRFLAWNR